MQLAVNIAVLAAIYALISCGYVLIYRTSRVLNLAHGELLMAGGYTLFATRGWSAFARVPMVLLVVVALAMLGYLGSYFDPRVKSGVAAS